MAPVSAQRGAQRREWQAGQDVPRSEPGTTGGERGPVQVLEASDGMRVARQHDLHAAIAREPRMSIVQVAAMRLAVDFEGDAKACGLCDHGFDVEAGCFAAQQHAPGGMSQHVHVRAFHGPQHAICHPLGFL